MLERSFLDALKADPNDELTRLAYADWLEEHGDERAELLRLEMEMLLKAPTRALHLRVSELAGRAEIGWLCAASLMSSSVAAIWRHVARTFPPARIEEDAMTWAGALAELRVRFREAVIPYSYTLFQGLFPGRWFRAGGPENEHVLWEAEMVLSRTLGWYDELPDSTDLWLSIGAPWSSHQEDYLCCTADHFGMVVRVGGDEHPAWGDGFDDGPRPFVDYLTGLAR
jgi:uncharacterized protein (TIGR02996 family)